jgi:hypothetical protein
MFWDDLVRRWRRDAGGLSPRLLRGAAGQFAIWPGPRPNRSRRVQFVLLTALGLALIALLTQTGHVQAQSTGVESATAAITVA